MKDPISGRTAICGLGITPMGRIYDRSVDSFAAEAILLACADAGIDKDRLDGLLINSGVTGYTGGGISLALQGYLGLRNLRLLNHMNAMGATAPSMVQFAALAVHHGMADYVACVFADAPLQAGTGSAASYSGRHRQPTGMASLDPAFGFFGATTGYALAARRYMETYGVGQDKLGLVAVAQRAWALLNPHATMHKPLALEDYHASRWVVEPFHLLDCCLVSNGAVAVIVTRADRARDARAAPAYILGMGQGHPGNFPHADVETGTTSGAVLAGRDALAMAGLGLADIDVCEFYDCYTYTVLRTLEDYGFCGRGEAGDFIADGRTRPGGAFPLNTGGGQLSSFYMWGMTPLSEGVIQARGSGGARQVARHDAVLVSGNGGVLDTHGTLILGPDPG
ncbi:MAG: thiolase family protein [Gammaproteobacteria bacterium]